ncbi:MAG: peptidase M6, partial [Acidobacteriota bacterium]
PTLQPAAGIPRWSPPEWQARLLAAHAPQGDAVRPDVPAPIDQQRVQDQQDMTWSDYHPIPGASWADPLRPPERALRVALVAVDFEDQPFVITRPKQSDPFGNPQVEPIARADVAHFYADFLGRSGPLNHGHTIHEYWMEQSRGKVGIPVIAAFGPYRMPKRSFQYGLNEYGQRGACPSGYTCEGRLEADADALWTAAAGAGVRSDYDIVLRIYAGYDETSVWQEFGEMMFAGKDDIPAAWGNPDATQPRWVVTRYVPWTSWLAGAQQWGLSSIRQGESSGTITHEIAHFAFRTGDNNNNPYAWPYRRAGSGPWDVMDRGTFNGPGGPHRRWVVPATEGAAMPAGFMLRNRMRLDFVQPAQVLRLSRTALAASGLAVATITARAAEPGPNAFAGLLVTLDGDAPQDRTPRCDRDADSLCAGDPVFNSYSVEVVQRIGYDSFTPDDGVLLAKNKDRENNSCGYNCFTWVIDANPEDIGMLDFVRPGGMRVMRTVADYRQLNDALFHAGAGSGSQYEWEDAANRLHFYVIDLQHDRDGILSYTVGVRSMDGAGTQVRGVTAVAPQSSTVDRSGEVRVALTNTGAAGVRAATRHPGAPADAFAGDVYRLSAAIDGSGWSASLPNVLAALQSGETATVPVRIQRTASSTSAARLTVTARSESDPSKTTSVTTAIAAR